MNRPAEVTARADGYVQDRASQWVAESVGAPGRASWSSTCAPRPAARPPCWPGRGPPWWPPTCGRRGSASWPPTRARLGLGSVAPVAADGARPPFRPGSFDRVLLDAPCSGLGALRRRPDARWRIAAGDVGAPRRPAARPRRPRPPSWCGPAAVLVYSVCTLTAAESLGVDEHLASARPDLVALDPPGRAVAPPRARCAGAAPGRRHRRDVRRRASSRRERADSGA